MDNRSIAQHFDLLAKLMELHDENPFKYKSYNFAARHIKNIATPLENLSVVELEQIEGIGKAIAAKIFHLCQTGHLDLLDKYLQVTPNGVVDLLTIKGIGPKKIRLLWQDLEIESIGELYYACKENRLITLKGFGAKTQQNILEQIEFLQQNANSFLYVTLETLALDIIADLQTEYNFPIQLCGNIRRLFPILEQIDILIATTNNEIKFNIINKYKEFPIQFHFCSEDDFTYELFRLSSDENHFNKIKEQLNNKTNFESEQQIYEQAKLPFIIPALRDNHLEWKLIENNQIDKIIKFSDIKGVVHNHSKYSDGSNTIAEMAQACINLNYEYLVMSDHSQSAFYANGLKENDIIKQHQEIDKLNKNINPFKIFKSIESDILYDGRLDYPNEILAQFDLIIASVHSQLNMQEDKAMERLIKAIENPYTTILGHMTGRLLLSRKGYPVNHKKIIDACAANRVVIEINANPHRLDIDYTWIDYCMEKGVWISINPDAHNINGIKDIRYGVNVAQKGALLKEKTLNALNLPKFEAWLKENKKW
ncbi:MAG: helix-hairpin-helix domain-containing protein [Chitinophagales bacterium]